MLREAASVPSLEEEVKVLVIFVRLGSLEFVLGLTDATTMVDPLTTPTTLTLLVSTMLSNAHRLLMKFVTVLSLLKKSLISIWKWVVS